MGQLGVDVNVVTPAIRDNIFIVVHQVLDDVIRLSRGQLRAREGRFAVRYLTNTTHIFIVFLCTLLPLFWAVFIPLLVALLTPPIFLAPLGVI